MKFEIFLIVFLVIIIIILLSFKYDIFNFNMLDIYKKFLVHIIEKTEYGNFIFKHHNEIIAQKYNNPNEKVCIINIININNFMDKIYNSQEVGLGESFMDGDWTCNDLTTFLTYLYLNFGIIKNQINIPFYNFFNKNPQTDKNNIKHHYDVGNDFYLLFLKDDLSAYSCGMWSHENDILNNAQYNKVNIIIKKLNIDNSTPKKILDIGCGWGKIANYVAKITKSKVIGITVSDEQVEYSKNNFSLNDVEIFNMDYRLLSDKFDYIYSIGMFEHVKYENYDVFFQMIKRCLKENSRFLLHTIIQAGTEISDPNIVLESFISKHIFPGGQIPTNDWIVNSIKKNKLNIIHYEAFSGCHYSKTLKVWKENLIMEKDNEIMKKYENEFKKYEYYFSSCEALFKIGDLMLGHYLIVNSDTVSLDNAFYNY